MTDEAIHTGHVHPNRPRHRPGIKDSQHAPTQSAINTPSVHPPKAHGPGRVTGTRPSLRSARGTLAAPHGASPLSHSLTTAPDTLLPAPCELPASPLSACCDPAANGKGHASPQARPSNDTSSASASATSACSNDANATPDAHLTLTTAPGSTPLWPCSSLPVTGPVTGLTGLTGPTRSRSRVQTLPIRPLL